MFSKIRIALGLALMLSLALAIPVFAGGWAVITLDEMPTNVVAGESITIGFTVLQHGQTPMAGLTPTVTVMLPKAERFVVNAEPYGKPGHYTATLTFPMEGNWNWSIQAFSMDQPMPVLYVAAPAVSSVGQSVADLEPVPMSVSPVLIVRLAALGIGLAGLTVAYRRRSRLAVAITVFCFLAGIASFMMGAATSDVEAQSNSSPEGLASKTSISDVEMGRQLFVAKGCITCHVNNKADNASAYWSVDTGPNLSTFSASPEILRIRLKDPSAAKSDTQMPNLGLKEYEIEALIAFINSK